MVIALAFFKRVFTWSLPMNQAHGLIIAEVYGACCVSTQHDVSRSQGSPEGDASSRGGLAKIRKITDGSWQNFLPLWGRSLASGYNS